MIKPGEIQNKAREVNVRDQQIEKDYALSWILQGIAKHDQLSKSIIFKGGTVLKKIYFKDYRFSEDIDFTLLDLGISNEQIFEWFDEVFAYVKDEANIPFEIIDDNKHEDGGINFYISYTGPLGGIGANKKVKVDISRNEKLVFEPVLQIVYLGYTDQEEHQLLCYSLEEVLVEKMRSVMQRMQARDFYDLWYLLEIHEMNVTSYLAEFRIKCENREIDPSGFYSKLQQRMPQYKGRWKSSMVDQIHDLPEFDQVYRELMRRIKNLEPK